MLTPQRRLRVGFDARALVFPAGGVRRYVHELYTALPGLVPGMEIVALDPPDGVGLPPGVTAGPSVAHVPTNLARAAAALPRGVRRARLDLFHAPAYTGPLAGRTPVVLTIHDVSYERRPEYYAYRSGALRRWFYRRCALAATRVVTDSAFSRGEIEAAYGIPASRIAVVPLGVGRPFEPAEDPAGVTLRPGVRRPYILHVGDLHVRRDVETALRAVMAVRQQTGAAAAPLQLVCAGTDRGAAGTLRQRAADAGMPDALVLLGAVSEPELVALYQGAAALVYPSRYEGFGLPALEAMACGLPVVAARAGSLPEVVGDAGMLVRAGNVRGVADAIGVLLSNPDRRAGLRDRGLRRAAGFSWERTARETLEVYRECLAHSIAASATRTM